MSTDDRDQDGLEDRSGLPATTVQDALILDRRKSKFALSVYVALCHFAKSTGRCFPSIRRLCEVTGLGETTVKTTIRELMDLGYLDYEHRRRADGGKTSNLYTIVGRYRFFPTRSTSPGKQGEGRPATMGDDQDDRLEAEKSNSPSTGSDSGAVSASPGRSHPRSSETDDHRPGGGQGRGATMGRVAPRRRGWSPDDRKQKEELVSEQEERERLTLQQPRLETTSVGSTQSVAPELSPLFVQRARDACSEHGLPAALISRPWLKSVSTLRGPRVGEEDLLEALSACLDAEPEKLTFFAQDYAKWKAKATQDAEKRKLEQTRRKSEASEREERDIAFRERELLRTDPNLRAETELALEELKARIGLGAGREALTQNEAR